MQNEHTHTHTFATYGSSDISFPPQVAAIKLSPLPAVVSNCEVQGCALVINQPVASQIRRPHQTCQRLAESEETRCGWSAKNDNRPTKKGQAGSSPPASLRGINQQRA